MSKERPAGKDGKHYYFKPGEQIVGDGLASLPAGWYLIAAKSAAASTLPAGKAAGAMFHSAENLVTPAEGDIVIPLEIAAIEWATDGEVSASRGVVEDTVQSDAIAHFQDEGYPNSTYSLSGYNRIGDDLQKELKNRTGYVSVDDGAGSITVSEPKGDEIIFGVCSYESAVSGETEEWTLFSGLITSLTLNKPLKGNQDFSLQLQLNYRDTYLKTVA
jgi:hypothetical protein